MTSTKWKRSSTRWMLNTIVAIWEVYWKQWEHKNTILHHDQHPWKQREIKDIDEQIHAYRNQYQSTLYLPRDQTLFTYSTTFIHQYPTTIKQQWLQSIAKVRLRKLAADIIPVSQEIRLLRSWLRESDRQQRVTSNNFSTESENNNRIEIREHIANKITIPTTKITTATTKILQINSIAQAFPKRKNLAEDGNDGDIENKQTPSFKRPRLIPLPLLRTIDYQYGRVMNRKRERHSTNHEKEYYPICTPTDKRE